MSHSMESLPDELKVTVLDYVDDRDLLKLLGVTQDLTRVLLDHRFKRRMLLFILMTTDPVPHLKALCLVLGQDYQVIVQRLNPYYHLYPPMPMQRYTYDSYKLFILENHVMSSQALFHIRDPDVLQDNFDRLQGQEGTKNILNIIRQFIHLFSAWSVPLGFDFQTYQRQVHDYFDQTRDLSLKCLRFYLDKINVGWQTMDTLLKMCDVKTPPSLILVLLEYRQPGPVVRRTMKENLGPEKIDPLNVSYLDFYRELTKNW